MAGFMVFDDTELMFQTFLPDTVDLITYESIEGGDGPVIVARGDIQPMVPTGSQQISTPQGFSLQDAQVFITPEAGIPAIDDVGVTAAAQTTYKGRTYFVLRKFDYSNGSMVTDCVEYILILRASEDGSV